VAFLSAKGEMNKENNNVKVYSRPFSRLAHATTEDQ